MFSEADLRELLEFSPHEPVLSVYLNTDPTEGNADAYKLRLRNMLKGVDLPKDEEAVLLYFEHEYDWSGRGVAVFSCAGRDFFRAFSLAVPVRNWIYVDERPAVKPLADLLDDYGGYGVVLVDKQGARLFFFHLGELREQEGVMGEEVKHVKRGGASSFPGRRGGVAGRTGYADELVERNMRLIAEVTTRFFEENHVRRVLIGGTDDNVAIFRGLLPKTWQSLVVGSFPMSMTASHSEVLAKAMQIGKEAERRREARLVDQVITAARKGAGGVVDLEDTLRAVNEGRVQRLLVLEDFRAPGYQCQSCGHLTAKKLTSCEYCGGTMKEIPDAVELAVREVMKSGGEVDVIHAAPALSEAGGIGAILRY
jgi:peptide chain release factor subunit 1